MAGDYCYWANRLTMQYLCHINIAYWKEISPICQGGGRSSYGDLIDSASTLPLQEMVQKEGDNDQANDQEEEGTEGESGEEEVEYDEEEQEEVKKIINT